MEINWFIISAIYCGIGVLVIVVGLFAGKQKEDSKKRFEEMLRDRFFQTSVIVLTIMIMMVLLWLPYVTWSIYDAWKVSDGGRK